MKPVYRKWLALMCLMLLVPAQGQAVEARNLFADVTDTLAVRMNEWFAAAMEQNMQDLKITLQADQTAASAGEAVEMQVEIINPRMHACTVDFQLTLSHAEYFTLSGGKTEETLFLPAARMDAEGTIVPGCVQRTYRAQILPVAGNEEGWMKVTAAASMQEGSRWYQSACNLTLCAPQISAVLKASNAQPAPQEQFYYEITLTNSGGAAGTAEVTLSLPEGTTYTPREAATPDEAAVLAQEGGALVVEGKLVSGSVSVPAATYDAQGKLIAPAQTVLRVPVTVDAQALEDVPAAERVIVCGATLNGEALQEERVTVRGPIIDCTLTPSLRDMEMGGMLHYTCVVENRGYAQADVRVTVKIPDGLKFERFITRGQGNKHAGDTLSWTVHLDKPECDLNGTPEPTREVITYQVSTQELDEGVRALIIPATAVYQIGETGQPVATQAALTTVHRPTIMGLSADEWFLIFWAGVVLTATMVILFVLIHRDGAKGD